MTDTREQIITSYCQGIMDILQGTETETEMRLFVCAVARIYSSIFLQLGLDPVLFSVGLNRLLIDYKNNWERKNEP